LYRHCDRSKANLYLLAVTFRRPVSKLAFSRNLLVTAENETLFCSIHFNRSFCRYLEQDKVFEILCLKETTMNKMTWIALGVVTAVLLSMAVFCPLAGKCPMHLFQ